jgi:uncharacterized membrane protein YfcA
MIDAGEIALLAAATLATSALSGVLGMAGGAALLAVMLIWLPPLVAIPLHGAVQLVSNGSRTLIQRRHVRWPIFLRFVLPLIPAGAAGLLLARAIPPEGAKLAIGVLVLVVTWRPAWLRLARPAGADPVPLRRFVGLGGAVGFLGPAIGATGPLMEPFFLGLGLERQGLIGTKAACQAAAHLAKIAVFGAAGFAFGTWGGALALLAAASVIGTWIGSRLLDGFSEEGFRRLYVAVLTLVALRLVGGEALALVR